MRSVCWYGFLRLTFGVKTKSKNPFLLISSLLNLPIIGVLVLIEQLFWELMITLSHLINWFLTLVNRIVIILETFLILWLHLERNLIVDIWKLSERCWLYDHNVLTILTLKRNLHNLICICGRCICLQLF